MADTTHAATWGPELAVVLGIVEGLTEYLPVSSTGHLILAGHLLGFTGAKADAIEISIQFGAILAVLVYERHKIVSLFRHAHREQAAVRQDPGTWFTARYPSLRFLVGLVVAFLPAGVVGFLAHDWIEGHLFNPGTVAAALIIGAIVLWWVESERPAPRFTELEQIGIRPALWVGIAQCFSLIPGTSRSGATIVGGLLLGMDRKIATEYSFFLAMPTLIVATVYKMIKARALLTEADVLALAIGLVVSFLVAWGVIALFLNYVKRHNLRLFAVYRVLLGVLVLWIS